MKDNWKIVKYNVKFQQLASKLEDWGDKALCHHYYKGLPAHIKDALALRGEIPSSLILLWDEAIVLNKRYWERQAESSWDSPASSSHNTDHHTQSPEHRTESSNTNHNNTNHSRPNNYPNFVWAQSNASCNSPRSS